MGLAWPASLLALRDRVGAFVALQVVPLEAQEADAGLQARCSRRCGLEARGASE